MTEGEITRQSIQADIESISKIQAVPSILDVICRTTGMGFAAIARVTNDTWVACAVHDDIRFGLSLGGELDLKTTLCHEVHLSQEVIVIDNVAEDKVYCNHHTPALYGFQSYISVPIFRKDGTFFGTLCAIDPKPASLNTPEVIDMFKLYADLVSFHLNAVEQLAVTNDQLLEEQRTAGLRDQFIAILGHDLRNPVGAVMNAAQMLLRMPLDDRALRISNIILDASYRIKGLIENVLDFARGEMGNGIQVSLRENEPLEMILGQVIIELSLQWPDREINRKFDFNEPVTCDGRRIAQMLSNLLSNALTHGSKDSPVSVVAYSGEGHFNLTVTNAGEKIPDEKIEHLFQPFYRGENDQRKQGLGLGLYIAAEIARAHKGTLSVTSTVDETRFTFEMPITRESN